MTAHISASETISISLPREIDLTNADQICADLCAHAIAGTSALIADMTNTRFCDSSGFRMLLEVHDRLTAAAIQFTIVIPTGSPLMRAIHLIGFDQILTVAATTPEA
jgi:anti-sigma B factor antagonist